MTFRPGQALLWTVAPFSGAVLVKGETESGHIDLYHLGKDEFFSVSLLELNLCRTLVFRDVSLQVSNPAQWEIQSAIWARAYQRCGIPAPS